MTKNDLRDKWQEEACDIWVKSGGRGTVEAGTGTGKTYLGFKVATRYTQNLGKKQIHVVVPSRLLKMQWEEALPKDLSNVQVFVINTYVKEDRQCGLLILDEMHNYAAPKFVKVLRTNCENLLGLTATLKRKDGKHILLMKYAPLIYRLPLEKARKLGFVSDFQVYNLGIEFTDPKDKADYQRRHSAFVSLFQLFDRNFDTLMECVKGNSRVIGHIAKAEEITEGEVKQKAFMAMRSMKARQELLYQARSKIPVLQELLERTQVQTIVFTQTIESCESIVDALPDAIAYHSGIKGIKENGKKISAPKVKQRIIDDFEAQKFSTLVGAKALNEGFSVNEVELAVFFSYTSDIRTFVQRMGRAVRFVAGKKAKIVAFYMKPFDYKGRKVHSQELKWLKEAQKSNIGSVKWVDSVDEILEPESVEI